MFLYSLFVRGVSRGPRWMLDALELELQTAVSHAVGAGDWTLGPLQEPVSALKCQDVSPTP